MRFVLRLLARAHIQKLIIVLALDAVLFGGSNARNVSSLLLMTGFILLVATAYYLLVGLVSLSGFYGLRFKRPRYLAACLAAVAGGLVALQSVGELGPRDAAVLLPLAALAYLYSSYGSSSKRTTVKE